MAPQKRPTLSRGYLNDAERTRKAFIDGSTFEWALPDETRFYASGDIVRQNSDGSINFVGRRDLQTKINGFRVELEEVEHEVERCDGIKAAVVVKVQQNNSEILVAFFTLTTSSLTKFQDKLLTPTDGIRSMIRTASANCTRKLPPYMVPTFYLPIDQIPLTTSGKLDRAILRVIFDKCSREEVTLYITEPVERRETKTTIQKVLQGLWAQVLSSDSTQIGLDSHFVILGGDSLAAIKLATMCREIGFRLTVADILRSPGFEDMATLIERTRNSSRNKSVPLAQIVDRPVTLDNGSSPNPAELVQIAAACGLETSQIESVLPCTPIQEILMAVTARIPEAYIACDAFRLPPGIDLKRFRDAWELVHRHNPILRTRICSVATRQGVNIVQAVCNIPCDWLEAQDDGLSNADMSMGKSLFKYRLFSSSGSIFLKVFKHHAIFDGFMAKLLWDDFRHAYERMASPPARPPFRNYVDYLRSLDEEETIQFWKTDLEGFAGGHFPILPSLEFTPRTNSKSCVTIEAELKWKDSCQYTFATIVRAAWGIIQSMRSRTSGPTKDVCFAATTSGRSIALKGIEEMAGPTITTVPLRIQLHVDQPVGEYLQEVHKNAISMLPFEYYGLGRIQAVSGSAREACKTPTLLVVQPVEFQESVLPLGIERVVDDTDGMVELFGLVIECMQSKTQGSISLSGSFDTSLLDEEEVKHMLQQLSWMIARLKANEKDDCTIRSAIWSLANEHDFEQILKWNTTAQASPACLHGLVEEAAQLYPNDIAVDAVDGILTYSELVRAADSLAAILLEKHNVNPGDLIPLCFEKSKYMIVAILGILKANAGYVPLDICHPISRTKYIISEVKATVVVLSSLQAKRFKFSMPILVLDSETASSHLSNARANHANPRDVAYVTFTSGSTGKPKGVVTEHGAASLSVLEHGKRYLHHQYGTKTRALQFSSYTFDASVLDIFAVLAYGGCVCIPSEQDRLGDLQAFLKREEMNFADLTPTVANLLDPSMLPILTRLAIGGEMANRSLIKKWCSRQPPLENFVNSYGPTEVAIGYAMGAVNLQTRVGHVGKRVGGSLWIVAEEDHNHLVPIGCVGELVVSGSTLARGYLNDPERTKAAFIRNVPWLAKSGDTVLYKTGDIAKFDVSGNVEIVGRKDDGQIKLHGLRIELGEIESAIEGCLCFSNAQHLAVAKVNLAGNPTLVSFIKLPLVSTALVDTIFNRPSDAFRRLADAAEIELQGQLPQYMVPRLWLPVYSWPLNSSGKTDRTQLAAACERLSSDVVKGYQCLSTSVDNNHERPDKTEIEKTIEDAWKQGLKKAPGVKIAPSENFFRLGGDSLRTIMLISRLRAQELQITPQEVFATKTLGNMVKLIESKMSSRKADKYTPTNVDDQRGSDGQKSLIASSGETILKSTHGKDIPSQLLGKHDIVEVYPASYMQLAFLIEGQKWCRSYYAWSFLDIGTSATIAQVQKACSKVAQHHPILQTSFHLINHQCFQAVRTNSADFKIVFFNEFPADMCAKLDDDVSHPVCFGRVLTRFRLLIQKETGRRTLALGLSHAQYDGFSLPTILNDLGLAYSGKPLGKSPPSYRHYIDHILNNCNNETDSFWRETLKGSK